MAKQPKGEVRLKPLGVHCMMAVLEHKPFQSVIRNVMLQQEAAMLTEVESLQKNSSQTMAQGDHVLVKLLLIADVHLPWM